MADDVSQPFLKDAEEFRGVVLFQSQFTGGNRYGALNAGTRGEFIRLPLDGCRQSKIVEHAGSQPAADLAPRAHSVIDEPDGSADPIPQLAFDFRQMPAHPRQI